MENVNKQILPLKTVEFVYLSRFLHERETNKIYEVAAIEQLSGGFCLCYETTHKKCRGDIVSHIEDITLREATQPENRILLNSIFANTYKEKEKSKETMTDEIELEELEEKPQVKRRKLRNTAIMDEIIELSSDDIRLPIDNYNVETNRMEALTGILKEKHPSNMKSFLEKIDVEAEAVAENYEGNLELRDVSKQMDTTEVIVQVAPEACLVLGAAASGRTQASPETRRPEQHVGEKLPSPKRRRSDVSFPHNLQKSLEPSIAETNKLKVPRVLDPSALLTALLQRHRLADSSEGEENAPQGEGRAPEDSSASETPLSSIDTTIVSLGDSENTTDFKKFIREEWGTQGVMHKIYHCIKSGSTPVDVHSLVSDGPVLCGQRRLIAARCFTSILKLKQHGMIRIDKDSETNEIKDIKFGSKIVRDE